MRRSMLQAQVDVPCSHNPPDSKFNPNISVFLRLYFPPQAEEHEVLLAVSQALGEAVAQTQEVFSDDEDFGEIDG